MQRKIPFVNDEFHHIFNRGVDKRDIFMDTHDYERFLLCMDLLNDEDDGLMILWRDLHKKGADGLPKVQPLASQRLNLRKPLVNIIAYCLNSNHYHFILKQLQEKGIEKFMQKLGTSHTMYFNKKYSRSSSLFQGRFKSVYIDSNEYLLYLSVYINANNFIHNKNSESLALGGNLWPYSSLPDYLGKRKGALCNMEPVMGQFRDTKEYGKYVRDNALYMKEKKEMEKYYLE